MRLYQARSLIIPRLVSIIKRSIYTNSAKLEITPNPDSVLRVFMAYKALDKKIEIEEPVIEPFERKGFTVIEWGGTEIK